MTVIFHDCLRRLNGVRRKNMTEKKELIDRFCAFCEKGTPIPSSDGENYVICHKKGLVSGNYVCGAFIYDPLKREPKRKENKIEFEVVDINEN